MSVRPSLGDLEVMMPKSPLDRPIVVVSQERMSEREAHLQLQMVCLLVANGESMEAVSTKTGISRSVVENLIKTPKALEMIVKFQHDICPEPRERIRKLASIALDVQTRLLLGPTSDNVKAKVAQEIIDRDMGKATQVVESRSMHFDIKDAQQVEQALAASQAKLARIEEMQKRLAVPIGRSDG